MNSPAKPFLICINYLTEPEGKVWAVAVGNRWHTCRRVICNVPIHTVFKGPKARQPKAYLRGTGRVVKGLDGVITIEP